MKTITEVFSINVKRLIGDMNRTDFAVMADIPYSTLNLWISGRQWPSEEGVIKIARALGIPPQRLFIDPDLKPTPSEALEVIKHALGELSRLKSRG